MSETISHISPAWYSLNENEVPFVKTVEYLSDPIPDWDFHDFMVVKDVRDGKFYWGEDSGCSCPSPFENYYKLADLNPLVRQTKDEFLKALDNYVATYGGDGNLQARDRLRKLVKAVR